MNDARIKHLPSGQVFQNRKEAKMVMGHHAFNRSLKNGEMLFVRAAEPSEIIL